MSCALLSLRSGVNSFYNGSGKGISARMMLVPCPVSPGAGASLSWMVPAGERCEQESWLGHGKLGFDLKAKAPAGADLLDVMNSPVLEWECGSGGKPNPVSRLLELSCRSTSTSTISLNF